MADTEKPLNLACFLKGNLGDNLNIMPAAAAWNLRKWIRELPWLLLPLILSTPRHSALVSP